MKFCRFCGAQISDDAAFCSNCGSRLQGAPSGPGNRYQQGAPSGPGNRYQQGAPPGPGNRYQQGPPPGPGRGYPPGVPAGSGYGKKVKKGGFLGKLAIGAVAAVAAVTVAGAVIGDDPGGSGKGGSGGGSRPTYGAYQQPGGNSGSGKTGKPAGGTGQTSPRTGSPISGGRLVSCNKPLRVLNESGYNAYELLDAIDMYGKNAPSHIEVLPANNTVSINGNKITIKLPNVAFKFTCGSFHGGDPRTMVGTRDELTIYGTITESGETVEGEAYMEYERTGNRRVFYAAGPIDKVDGITSNGAFSARITDASTGSYEHLSVRNTYSHPRTGNDYYFSKFSLDYFPEDDYYMLSIFLYGDSEEDRYYPTMEDEYVPHINREFPQGRYSIVLISDYDVREASKYSSGIWN